MMRHTWNILLKYPISILLDERKTVIEQGKYSDDVCGVT